MRQSLELIPVLDLLVNTACWHLLASPLAEVALRHLLLEVQHPGVLKVRSLPDVLLELFQYEAQVQVVLRLNAGEVVVSHDDAESSADVLEADAFLVHDACVHFVDCLFGGLTLLALEIVKFSSD